MSVETSVQVGGDEPLPELFVELQQMAIGMFLIYDALGGKDYMTHELAEQAPLSDWARKYHIRRDDALEALQVCKERLTEGQWATYIHCRELEGEGWVHSSFFRPRDNEEVLSEIRAILERRPFGKEPEKGLKN